MWTFRSRNNVTLKQCGLPDFSNLLPSFTPKAPKPLSRPHFCSSSSSFLGGGGVGDIYFSHILSIFSLFHICMFLFSFLFFPFQQGFSCLSYHVTCHLSFYFRFSYFPFSTIFTIFLFHPSYHYLVLGITRL